MNPFLARSEVLADPCVIVVRARLSEEASDLAWARSVGAEDPDPTATQDRAERAGERAAVHADDVRTLPTDAGTSERQLHRAEGRLHADRCTSQRLTQHAADSIEERVARCKYHGPARVAARAELFYQTTQVVADEKRLGRPVLECVQVPLAAGNE